MSENVKCSDCQLWDGKDNCRQESPAGGYIPETYRNTLPCSLFKARPAAPELTEGLKATNPKDALGTGKLHLSLCSPVAMAHWSNAQLNGALKYGAHNWRKAGIRASVYLDAALRHLYAWQQGEECDPDDGVTHLGAVMACVGILLDARAAGKLQDDRPPSIAYRAVVDELQPHVRRLQELHAGKNPRHFTISDTEEGQ